jgi:hypothetical protein
MLVYTGERRKKKKGEWWVISDMGAVYCECEPDGSIQEVLIAVPKPPRRDPSLKKVNVLTIDATGKLSRYHFYGVPDWQRVEKETIGEGFKAAIVWPRITALEGDAEKDDYCPVCVLVDNNLDICYQPCSTIRWMKLSNWDYINKNDVSSIILKVRAALKKTEKKPEHWNGEPCTLKPAPLVESLFPSDKYRFEYPGYKGHSKGDELFDVGSGWIYKGAWSLGVWHVRAVPKSVLDEYRAKYPDPGVMIGAMAAEIKRLRG